MEMRRGVGTRGVKPSNHVKELKSLTKDLDLGFWNRVVPVEIGAIPFLANTLSSEASRRMRTLVGHFWLTCSPLLEASRRM